MTKDNLGQLYADMFGPNQRLWSARDLSSTGIVKPTYLPQVGVYKRCLGASLTKQSGKTEIEVYNQYKEETQ